MQALEEQVRDFPEQLRRERASASAQAEELHSRAAMSIVTQKSAEYELRLQSEKQTTEAANAELKRARDRCSVLESQLKSSGDSVVALQSQLSKADGDWRHEFDAMQRQLQEQALQMETMRQQLQDQTSRADEATVMWREAEADVRQCRHAMQLDADRLQVMRCESDFNVCVLLACERR